MTKRIRKAVFPVAGLGGSFDAVTVAVTGGTASTTAMGASTETAQSKKPAAE